MSNARVSLGKLGTQPLKPNAERTLNVPAARNGVLDQENTQKSPIEANPHISLYKLIKDYIFCQL